MKSSNGVPRGHVRVVNTQQKARQSNDTTIVIYSLVNNEWRSPIHPEKYV